MEISGFEETKRKGVAVVLVDLQVSSQFSFWLLKESKAVTLDPN